MKVTSAGGPVTSGRKMHLSYAKSMIIDTIAVAGARTILTNWNGTNDEAIAMLEKDPRSYFVVSDECDDQGADGYCNGHPTNNTPWTALTVCNPYPELILNLEKPIENRTLNYRFRGRLFIHAGKSRAWMSVRHLRRFAELPYGAIVGVANVVASLPKNDREQWAKAGHGELFDHQHANGPYCLILKDIKRLSKPVPCSGAQGLWRVPTNIRAQVLEQLRVA